MTGVEIKAWADFNGDEIEDLLMASASSPITWNLEGRRPLIATSTLGDVYVVTRGAPGAVLRVVDAERHLTPEKLEYEPCVYP